MNDRSVVMVNLRVLAKLKAGDRLQSVDSRYFSIDRGLFTWLTRWVRNDNRSHSIDRIEETFEKAKGFAECTSLLPAAKQGVEELKATYVGDDTTVSRLEHIVSSCDTQERAL